MDTEVIEKELEALLPKLEEGNITYEEKLRFLTLYKKYAKMVGDEVKIETIKQELSK